MAPRPDSDRPQPTLRRALAAATERLIEAGCETAALDARLLLQAACGLGHEALIMRMEEPLPPTAADRLEAMVARRARREPIAYILGYRHFWKQRIRCDRRALIPRPETELLIEALLARLPERQAPLHLCDMATGSGCLAVAMAMEYPHATVHGCDLSKEALELAGENITAYDLQARVSLHHGDLFAALPPATPPFDAILCNPPYVARDELAALAPELAYEPRMALTDEKDGASILRRLLHEAPRWLRPGGWLIVETGACGLPKPSPDASLRLDERIFDLAGLLRGGVWRRVEQEERPVQPSAGAALLPPDA
ncbi:MAG: peptide chain release factor N(5)-glutamine methyltransferase [Zetaproteobacteria bacterium]|nr:MAG: peptide chain release factor N(5)-glutamine methyltransferase [Zetaproteobacteria bacterium]